MSTEAATLLSVERVSKSFGGIQALDEVAFAVQPGEILGLVGPNGAGKSVLVNVISGFYEASGGSIRFRGRDITRLPGHEIARLGIARTFQNIRLFRRMTVLENVMVAFKEHARRPLRSVVASSRRADIDRALAHLDRMHLADKADQPAASLPYGEARRLEIARALAGEPSLLFLDEPAAGMNDQETDELKEDIRKVRASLDAIVIIEHDVELLRELSDRMVALDYGRKIAEGRPAEVLSHPDVVEAYLGPAYEP